MMKSTEPSALNHRSYRSRSFVRQLRPALISLLIFSLALGIAYPLVVTGIGQVLFHDNANGSLISADGEVVGSKLIGQQFVTPKYFHPRPSSAGDGYDGSASAGSNLGPSNPAFLALVAERVDKYLAENGLPNSAKVPADAVTASNSGLDPQISVANARLQAARVAEARSIPIESVMHLVARHTEGRPLGVLGDPGVNVIELNLALDNARR